MSSREGRVLGKEKKPTENGWEQEMPTWEHCTEQHLLQDLHSLHSVPIYGIATCPSTKQECFQSPWHLGAIAES